MKSELPNAKAEKFYDFMIEPTDEAYSNWLPEHYQYHIVKRGKQTPIGDLVYFDQNISPKHRLKSYAITKVANRPNQIIVQIRMFGINLPAYMELQFTDTANGILLKEELQVGYNGIGKILDPIIRLFINKSFLGALDAHHKKEWARLAEILKGK